MGKGMSKVVNNLYVGSFADSNDKETLDRVGITHIVTAMESGKRSFEDKTYLIIEVSDTYAENISQHFPRAIEFIHEQRILNKGVLVHCMAGASRSVTLVVAYLATISGMAWRDCLNAVRAVRRQANPNLGFQQQLDIFERQYLKEMRTTLFERFPNYHLADEDEKAIRALVSAFALEASLPRHATPFYDDLPASLSVAQHLGVSPAGNSANSSNAITNMVVSPGGSAVGFTIPPTRTGKRYPPSLQHQNSAAAASSSVSSSNSSNENDNSAKEAPSAKTESEIFDATEQISVVSDAIGEKL